MHSDPFIALLGKLPRSPETIRSYMCKVRTALKICSATTVAEMVGAPATSYRALEAAYPQRSTLKQTLTAILSTIGANEAWCLAHPSKQAKWRGFHALLSKTLHTTGAKVATTHTLGKYVCWKTIKAVASRLARDPTAHDTLASSQECLLFAVVTQLPPKRSDYGDMLIVDDATHCRGNCIVVSGSPRILIRDHKTTKSHGVLEERVPSQLLKIVRASLATWPRTHLFVSRGGKQSPLTADGFGSFVKRTMSKHLGKPVGVTMLRHIFISDVVSKLPKDARAEMARRMLHSTAEQERYVVTHPGGAPICD